MRVTLTRHNHVFVVAHQIVDQAVWGHLDICIPPVDPAVGRSQRRVHEPVPGLGHQLPSARLRSESMPTLNILLHLLPKIFVDDRDFTVRLLWIWIRLQLLQ